jgi:hypothetical protein
MRAIVIAICGAVLAGCQSVPWRDEGPLFKLTNIAVNGGSCMALADFEGQLILRKNRGYAVKSADCPKVDGAGHTFAQADSIEIRSDGVRAARVNLSWDGGGGTLWIYRRDAHRLGVRWLPVSS